MCFFELAMRSAHEPVGRGEFARRVMAVPWKGKGGLVERVAGTQSRNLAECLALALVLLLGGSCVRHVAMALVNVVPVEQGPCMESVVDPVQDEESRETNRRMMMPGPYVRVRVETLVDLDRLARKLRLLSVWYDAFACGAEEEGFAALARGPIFHVRDVTGGNSVGRKHVYDIYLPRDLSRSVTEAMNIPASLVQGVDLRKELARAERDGLCVLISGWAGFPTTFRTRAVRIPVNVCNGIVREGICESADDRVQ